MHLKRSAQLFPHVDLGPRQDPLEAPANGPSIEHVARPSTHPAGVASRPAVVAEIIVRIGWVRYC